MKKRVLLMLMLLLSVILTTSCNISQGTMKYTTDQKVEDFLFVYDLLEKEYPLFDVKNRQYDVNWLENKDEYKKRISKTKNDKEFFVELYNITKELKDGHTHILSPPFYYYIKELIADSVLKYPSIENEFLIKPLGMVEGDYEYWNTELKGLFKNYKKGLDSLESVEENIAFKEYHNGDTRYIKFSSFLVSDEGLNDIKSYIADSKNCSNIIIDIRDNKGGSDLQWMENIAYPLMNEEYIVEKLLAFRGGKNGDKYVDIMLENDDITNEKLPVSVLPKVVEYPPELADDFDYCMKSTAIWKPKNPIGFNGDIYVLINNKVYSSGEGFATFCKRTGFATLVGERTRGDGGSSAPILVKLPNSGLLLRMRLQMTLNPNGSASAEYGTDPDIEVNAKDALTETLKIIEGKSK